MSLLRVAVMAVLCFCTSVATAADTVPLIASYDMEPDATHAARLVDRGPQQLHGELAGARRVAGGHSGHALRFDGPGSKAIASPAAGQIVRASNALTLAAWMYIERLPAKDHAQLFGHVDWSLIVGHDGNLAFKAHRGSWHFNGPWISVKPLARWMHVAVTYRQGGRVRVYFDGQPQASAPADFWIWSNNGPFTLGGSDWAGLLDDVHVYAAELTAEQVQADMTGQLTAIRAPTAADVPPPLYSVNVQLVRYDCPQGNQSYGRRMPAQRRPGPDAVDWPRMELDGKPVFAEGSSAVYDGRPRRGSPFPEPGDATLWPGNHWFRVSDWLWGRKFAYTADATVTADVQEVDLWTFPVVIRGAGDNDVRDVRLAMEGKTIYEHAAPLRSLTLLLPQNEPGKPYQLTVAARGPVAFEAGLQPITPGNPREVLRPIAVQLPGAGPAITVGNLPRPDPFPYAKAWAADQQAMQKFAEAAAPAPAQGFGRYVGLTVPRSPVAVYAADIPHGMAGGGGFFYINQQQASHPPAYASLEEYARFVAGLGYDRIVEMVERMPEADDPRSYEHWAAALAAAGVQSMISPDVLWKRPYLAHPNLAFFSHNLPDWHAPLYRDLQLAVARLARSPGFAGVCIGADNAGYVSYWDWAPPIPDRPWGEAFLAFQQGRPLRRPLRGEEGFLEHVARYDETFRQYAYFAAAVAAIDPRLATTSGSYGSSPGVGGRGGWPWATIPGKPMHAGLPVLQAYDWNELPSSKPLHVVALIDRLKSYYPNKPAWTLIDDFCFLHDRFTRQRAWALALTRGVQAVGTTFLPAPKGPRAWPEGAAEQQELFAWVHRFGGVYAASRPLAAVGVLYVHQQAVLRPVESGVDTGDDVLINRGCHEGKTTEALFLCHAAGWPARIVTPEELQRGLPADMKTLLLVGLPKIDRRWVWHAGIEPALAAFVAAGGKILRDHDSVCPVESQATGLRVRSYVPQRGRDWTPELLARNAENIRLLRTAMQGATPPLATSDDPTLWAVPTVAGDVWYLTAVNQQMTPDTSTAPRPEHNVEVAGTKVTDAASATRRLTLQPRRATLTWNVARPVYDLRTQRRLSDAEKSAVDLSRDAFQFYALPPAAPTTPAVSFPQRPDGSYAAEVRVGQHPMRGIPVQIDIRHGDESATLYGASGTPIVLPVRAADGPGRYALRVSELLSGLSTTTQLDLPAPPATAVGPRADLAAFAARRDRPLVVVAAPGENATQRACAAKLQSQFQACGRRVSLQADGPEGIECGLQPLRGMCEFPHWRTPDVDLVLLGSPRDNVLIYDQARGGLLPGATDLHPGEGRTQCVHSPFAGECDVLNVLGADAAGLTHACQQVLDAR